MFSMIGKKGGTTVGIGRGGKNLIKDEDSKNLKDGGYLGSAIKSEYGGVKLSNKSYEKYYKDKYGKSMI